jgi:DNA-directed RNA polymerase beta subunit
LLPQQRQHIKQLVNDRITKHQIASYNRFINTRLQQIINEVGEINPELPGGEELVIKLGKVTVDPPMVKEADGSIRHIKPGEARIRDLTYASRVHVEMTPIFEGVKQPSETVVIGEIPVMVGSDVCPTADMTEEEREDIGEDPADPGGYFIVKGTEKVLVSIEEIANNIPLYQMDDGEATARINSERQGYVQRHRFRKKENGELHVTFANLRKIPVVVVMRALGLETDQEIIETISEEYAEDLYVDLYEAEAATHEDAINVIANQAGITDDREERVMNIIDRYLLPHLGQESDARDAKATFLGNLAENVLALDNDEILEDDIDHYGFKRLQVAGDLLEMQFRSVFLGKWGFVRRMEYNFQKSAKRGRYPSLQSTVVSDTLTKQISSAMATGNWTGGRTGVAQRMERDNRVKMLDHLRNVTSPLSANRQHFEARELHPTHWGRIDPIKTPEGMNIGLRKHLAISADVTDGVPSQERNALKLELEDVGVTPLSMT